MCRKYNEECAALKARYPGRFMFCAALPLPDVPHALEEARYALEVLGADGIKYEIRRDVNLLRGYTEESAAH